MGKNLVKSINKRRELTVNGTFWKVYVLKKRRKTVGNTIHLIDDKMFALDFSPQMKFNIHEGSEALNLQLHMMWMTDTGDLRKAEPKE